MPSDLLPEGMFVAAEIISMCFMYKAAHIEDMLQEATRGHCSLSKGEQLQKTASVQLLAGGCVTPLSEGFEANLVMINYWDADPSCTTTFNLNV